MNNQTPATQPRFCSHCGTPLPEDSRFCMTCAAPVPVTESMPEPEVAPAPVAAPKAPAVTPKKPKRKGNFFKRNRTACILVSVFLLSVVITVLTWFSYNYIGLITAVNRFETMRALQFYENIPAAFPIPQKTADLLSIALYERGVSAYEAGDFDKAKQYFTDVEGYEQSAEYLLLIRCRQQDNFSEEDEAWLFDNMSFEDAGQCILENDDLVLKFLKGRWEEYKYANPYYIELREENGAYTIYHNLPSADANAPFFFSDGTYYSETQRGDIQEFSFSYITEDVISVYCHHNEETIILRRQ